jgi:PTS system ascorbate-specific IIA component
MQQLMQIFTNEPLLDALMAANTPEDILKAEADYPPEDDY